MGKHFDSLVDVLKGEVPQFNLALDEINIKAYLTELVNNFFLFDFPISKQEIRPVTGKDQEEYNKYVADYLRMSQQYGKHLIMPFEHLAIEDPDSAVFFDNIQGSTYYVTEICGIPAKKAQPLECFVNMGQVTVKPQQTLDNFPMDIGMIYSARFTGSESFNLAPFNDPQKSAGGLGAAALAFIQEDIYIEDPVNFIIKKENTQSKMEDKKREGHHGKERKPRKTMMRPHYTCSNEEDTVSFLRGESKEPRSLHPVRGYWKTLQSPRFKLSQGKILRVDQYWRGDGIIDGKNGWFYQVYLKKDPLTIVPVKN